MTDGPAACYLVQPHQYTSEQFRLIFENYLKEMSILPSFKTNASATGTHERASATASYVAASYSTTTEPVPLILKHGTYIKRIKNVHFFCSQKLNGKSGFAVNGDGLLYARESCPLEADFQNTNGRGDIRSV